MPFSLCFTLFSFSYVREIIKNKNTEQAVFTKGDEMLFTMKIVAIVEYFISGVWLVGSHSRKSSNVM